ncbi:DUF72 domain-containing protein [Paraflavitalea sp. CAU 1676]|uniref:DUF72 domain-containing protein n=1 Tax=Paraflavitalea sp. CAU 1676 TaxID=3032598 RepID=UPI0023DC9AE7|nr:DUF72 domain-containing protein [Paraflavitalea sp. CAU 1676]MDF2187031.1 DUF72 domain-containing protein [Paraflavitalea sp. CAU 1676]
MDFGKVPEEQLHQIDFSLPAESVDNRLVLSGVRKALPTVRLGVPRWGDKSWVGRLYPKGTKETGFMEQYVKHFNCVELNATHYKIYTPAEIAKWGARAAGKDFKFCPKVPQLISHYSNFNNVFDQTSAFLEGVLALEEHLGPIFLQVGETYGPSRRDALFKYLASLPTDLSFFLEVRNGRWFSDPVMRKELFDMLRSLKVGAVITDTAGRRDCAHMQLTMPRTFVRFVANLLHPTDYVRADAWVERITQWINQGLEELYFFVHMPEEMYCPELIAYIIDKLNPLCDLQLQKPHFLQADKPAAGTQISFFD